MFSDIYSTDSPVFSFEFFPPRKEEDLPHTLSLVSRLRELSPDFMTVTYGAGGGTRELTGQIVSFIARELDLPAVAHLTCVGHSREEIDGVLDNLKAKQISHVLALRGDPPAGQKEFQHHPEGFQCARDLITHIRNRGDFSIAAAGYPEIHPDAASSQADIDYLKSKVDEGAEVIITQLFFSAQMYFDFLEKTSAAGIQVPIVPGIMPIRSAGQVKRFTQMCGASLPDNVLSRLEELESDPDAVKRYGVELAVEICQELLVGGAPGIHLYTLNKSFQVEQVMAALRSSE